MCLLIRIFVVISSDYTNFNSLVIFPECLAKATIELFILSSWIAYELTLVFFCISDNRRFNFNKENTLCFQYNFYFYCKEILSNMFASILIILHRFGCIHSYYIHFWVIFANFTTICYFAARKMCTTLIGANYNYLKMKH